MEILLAQADTIATQAQSHPSVRSAYTGRLRMHAAVAGKPRLNVK